MQGVGYGKGQHAPSWRRGLWKAISGTFGSLYCRSDSARIALLQCNCNAFTTCRGLTACIPLVIGAYTFQITLTKTYSSANLFEDLRALYKLAGVKGQPVAFIFT